MHLLYARWLRKDLWRTSQSMNAMDWVGGPESFAVRVICKCLRNKRESASLGSVLQEYRALCAIRNETVRGLSYSLFSSHSSNNVYELFGDCFALWHPAAILAMYSHILRSLRNIDDWPGARSKFLRNFFYLIRLRAWKRAMCGKF